MTITLRRYFASTLGLVLDSISPGAVPNHAQFKAWDKLVTDLTETNKEFAKNFDALVNKKREFIKDQMAIREELTGIEFNDAARLLHAETEEKFKDESIALDAQGDEVISLEITDAARAFVQQNFDSFVFPGLTRLNASRHAIIEIAEQFLEKEAPVEAAKPAEIVDETPKA